MSRLRLQAQSKESKDAIKRTQLHWPYLNEGRIKPDAKKIQGIKRLMAPKNKLELQSLLGMFNYLGKFIPNLAAKTQDLRTLVKKNADFMWEKTHQDTRSTEGRAQR